MYGTVFLSLQWPNGSQDSSFVFNRLTLSSVVMGLNPDHGKLERFTTGPVPVWPWMLKECESTTLSEL